MRILFSILILLSISVQAAPINALALGNGAVIKNTVPSYAISSSTTSDIVKWSQEALLDENFSNGWCSKENTILPVELVFELSEFYILHQLRFGNACESFPGISTKSIKVEISYLSKSDGYTDLGVFELKENQFRQEFNIAPSKARWIRCTILSNYGHKKFTELMEIQAIGEFEQYNILSLPIEGVWDSNWDWVSLNRNAQGVYYGCYKYNKGTLYAGEVKRRVFEFEWEEKVINRKGWARLVINAEGQVLRGIWGFNKDRSRFGFWEFTFKTNLANQCWNDAEMKNKSPEEGHYNIPIQTPDSSKPILLSFDVYDSKTEKNIRGAQAEIFNTKTTTYKTVESGISTEVVKGKYTAHIHKKGYFYAELPEFYVQNSLVKKVNLTPIVKGEKVVLEHVLFKQGTAELVNPENTELDLLSRLMKDNSSLKLELSGHTDNQGNPADNLKLSEERAALIMSELIKRGINPSRLKSAGYGGTQPIADNTKEDTRKLNRRVEAKVLEF
jgi:outer membrane protein OmpA-like peptidoglycan-associated protein